MRKHKSKHSAILPLMSRDSISKDDWLRPSDVNKMAGKDGERIFNICVSSILCAILLPVSTTGTFCCSLYQTDFILIYVIVDSLFKTLKADPFLRMILKIHDLRRNLGSHLIMIFDETI